MPVKTIYICAVCGERAENKVDTIFELHRQGRNRMVRTFKGMDKLELTIDISGKMEDKLVCDTCIKKVEFEFDKFTLRVI